MYVRMYVCTVQCKLEHYTSISLHKFFNASLTNQKNKS